MILVVGATGLVGSEICRRLIAERKPVTALTRSTSDPAKVEALRQLGATIVQGDLRDRASLGAACRGASAVITTVSSMPFSYVPGKNDIQTTDLDGTLALVDAAAEAGVGHLVYTSFSGNLDLDFPLRNAKRTVEARLTSSGLRYTILRPSCFMEVWLSPAVGFDPQNSRATIYGTGKQPIAWIAAADVAEFAVRSLDSVAARNATLELGGPASLTALEAVAIFEHVGGTSFELHYVTEQELRAQQSAAADPMAQSFSGLMRCVAAGDRIDMAPLLELIPVRQTTVRDYAVKVNGALKAGRTEAQIN
jgi:NADH dehydrogenase